jgi:hypothetical protein
MLRRLLVFPLALLLVASLVACSSSKDGAEGGPPRPEFPFSVVPAEVVGVVRLNLDAIDTDPRAAGLRMAIVGDRSLASAFASLLATGERDVAVEFLGEITVVEVSLFQSAKGRTSDPDVVMGLKGRFTADELGALVTAHGWKAGGEDTWTKGDSILLSPVANVALMGDKRTVIDACAGVLTGKVARVTSRPDAMGERTTNSWGDKLVEGYFALPPESIALAMAGLQTQEQQYASIPGMKESVAELPNLKVIGLDVGAQGPLLQFSLDLIYADAAARGRALPGFKAAIAMAKMVGAAAMSSDPELAEATRMLERLSAGEGKDDKTITLSLGLLMEEADAIGRRLEAESAAAGLAAD